MYRYIASDVSRYSDLLFNTKVGLKYCSVLLLREINDVFSFEKHHVLFRLTTVHNNFIKTSHNMSIYHDMRYVDTV